MAPGRGQWWYELAKTGDTIFINREADVSLFVREVTGWSQVKKLPFPAKVVSPFRNFARLALPDPEVLEVKRR